VEKTIPTDKARQGGRGKQVLYVLIASLVLVAVVWGAVEIYGEQIDTTATDKPAATSDTTVPAN